MGLFKKVVKLAGYGGSQECKFCGKTKTIASTETCMAREGKPRPHVWVKAKQ